MQCLGFHAHVRPFCVFALKYVGGVANGAAAIHK